jgi:hypothetical protein
MLRARSLRIHDQRKNDRQHSAADENDSQQIVGRLMFTAKPGSIRERSKSTPAPIPIIIPALALQPWCGYLSAGAVPGPAVTWTADTSLGLVHERALRDKTGLAYQQ